ncbi:amidase [Verminephrobacter eiseniae]|uniref:amidase n=1 Tax=Verminephrobacter eiseniae TaxID=364317 RepID=UPI00223799FE|nr:amidase [Verminephrobacter eiseniae]MCW5237932.1 amidase [Verminephrobacter eiseniae]
MSDPAQKPMGGIPPIADAPALCQLGVAELSSLYRRGALSPVQVTQEVLQHVDRVQERFNAFSFTDHERALDMARASEARWRKGSPASPVDGVPTTIKDLLWVAGSVVRYGSLGTDAKPCAEDAPSVARLRAGGAIFVGITTSPELGWKAVTDSKAFGITRNPWAPAMTCGGSSGGAAVAAATGAGVLHLGTDGGGSIRIPASFCGIVGIKPTFGTVPAYPASAFGTVAHIGPMARSVDDAAAMLRAMSERDLRDWAQGWMHAAPQPLHDGELAKARIGYWTTPPSGALCPEVGAAVEFAVSQLRAAGARVERVDLPGEDLHCMFQAHWFASAANRLAGISAAEQSGMDAGLRQVASAGARISAPDLVAQQIGRAHFAAAMDRLLTEFDFLVSPAASILPFSAGLEVPQGSGLSRWTEWAGFSYPINLSQQPACVLPCARRPMDAPSQALPIGLQIIGARGADYRVLSIAREIERLGLEQLFAQSHSREVHR